MSRRNIDTRFERDDSGLLLPAGVRQHGMCDFMNVGPSFFGGSSGGGGGGDPYFSNVSLLLHMDGTNGSTTFTDNSPNVKTVTAAGNAQISTSQSKFGGASGYFDGSGDDLSIANNADFDFGSGNFTVEFFVNANVVTGVRPIVHRGTFSSFTAWSIHIENGKFIARGSVTGSAHAWNMTSTSALSSAVWYHVALVRNTTNVNLYVNGTSEVSASGVSGSLMSNATSVKIARSNDSSYFLNGYLDELRITNGVARYTANFTPPTAAFPNS